MERMTRAQRKRKYKQQRLMGVRCFVYAAVSAWLASAPDMGDMNMATIIFILLGAALLFSKEIIIY